jgi:outer membrane protein OmpA-like peptidoglycan-associated protein
MIPSSDYSKLQEIVNIAGQHPQMTVVLRGFASKVGNPQYNEKISFQRAASVKEWLLDNGLDLKNIITMHHGVDKSVDASRARRVEITFKVQ